MMLLWVFLILFIYFQIFLKEHELCVKKKFRLQKKGSKLLFRCSEITLKFNDTSLLIYQKDRSKI